MQCLIFIDGVPICIYIYRGIMANITNNFLLQCSQLPAHTNQVSGEGRTEFGTEI